LWFDAVIPGREANYDVHVHIGESRPAPKPSYPPTGRANARPMTGSGGYPVRRGLSAYRCRLWNTDRPVKPGDDSRKYSRGCAAKHWQRPPTAKWAFIGLVFKPHEASPNRFALKKSRGENPA